jgi:nucleotide-binding universal stress UspA family protein
MSSPGTTAVVVGVDYSPHSDLAVAYAAAEARLRNLPLRLVHAFGALSDQHCSPGPALVEGQALIVDAEWRLAGFGEALQIGHPGLSITSRVCAGSGPDLLVDESWTADLVVIGSPPRDGYPHQAFGSLAPQLTAQARCPVIVVPDQRHRTEPGSEPGSERTPVVVGVHDAVGCGSALEFAFGEARLRGVPLLAVHVRQPSTSDADADAADAETADAEQVLDLAVRRWQEKFPLVVVHQLTIDDDQAARGLVGVAEGVSAGLLVVGVHDHSGSTRLMCSVGRSLIEHAPVPVAVVRTTTARRPVAAAPAL